MLGNRVLQVHPDGAAAPVAATGTPPGSAGLGTRSSRRDRPWSIVASAAVLVVLLVGAFSWIYVDTRGSGGDVIDQSSLNAAPSVPRAAPSQSSAASASAAPSDQAAADALVAAARRDGAAYASPAAATAAGYRPARALASPTIRSAGVRFEIRTDDIGGRVDPAHPDGLMYQTATGGDRLVGMVFLGVSGERLEQPAGALTPWYPTALRTKGGRVVEALPVWFGPGVDHPFARTWDGATTS
jgi:hypothetical protein